MTLSLRIAAAALALSLLFVTSHLHWLSAQAQQGGISIGKSKAKPSPANKPSDKPTRKPGPSKPTTSAVSTISNIPRVTWPEYVTVTLDRSGRLTKQPEKKRANYFTENLGNGVTLEMVEIPSGKFTMGSPASEAKRENDEGPEHSVNVPSFWIGKFEITQAQWQALMIANPSNFKGDGNLPVEQVSWNDTQEFLKKLNALPNLKGKNYRLPTEAEWEYAARAGTTTPFTFGETITPDVANYWWDNPYANAPKKPHLGKTLPIGSFKVANAFGLFDMHGNVWEWCQDVYHENYNGAPSDGSAWLSGGDSSRRVLRGGSWYSDGDSVRSANRDGVNPGLIIYLIVGFRVVCSRTQNP